MICRALRGHAGDGFAYRDCSRGVVGLAARGAFGIACGCRDPGPGICRLRRCQSRAGRPRVRLHRRHPVGLLCGGGAGGRPAQSGLAHFAQKDYAAAIADYDAAIPLNPTYVPLFQDRARANIELKDFAHALDDFNAAIRLEPRMASGYADRGVFYLSQKDFAHALADFNQDIQIEPGAAAAFVRRCAAYMAQKDYDRALADLNKAIVLAPNYYPALMQRAEISGAEGLCPCHGRQRCGGIGGAEQSPDPEQPLLDSSRRQQ